MKSDSDRFDSLYDTQREVFTLSQRALFFWTAFWMIVGVLIGEYA